MAVNIGGLGQEFEICTTPQPADLTPTSFAGLTYIPVCCLEEGVEMSFASNIVAATCMSGQRVRLVGAPEDSDFEVTFMTDNTCTGQETIRNFGLAQSNSIYAMRKVMNDGVAGTTTPTTIYARGIFSGYTHNGVGVDDVQTETVTGSIIQGPIYVEAAPIPPP